MPGMDAIALLENLEKVKAVGMGKLRHSRFRRVNIIKNTTITLELLLMAHEKTHKDTDNFFVTVGAYP
jgi:hypothetical protein